MGSGRQLVVVALCVSTLTGGAGEVVAESSLFDPARVRWSRLDLRASKLAVTAISEVRIRTEPVSRAAGRWLGSSTGRPLMPEGSEVARIELRSEVLGKSSELDLWVDQVSGAAFQRTQLETGKKVRHHRHRSLRFTDIGVFNSTYRAADDTVDRPYKEWTLYRVLQAPSGGPGSRGRGDRALGTLLSPGGGGSRPGW